MSKHANAHNAEAVIAKEAHVAPAAIKSDKVKIKRVVDGKAYTGNITLPSGKVAEFKDGVLEVGEKEAKRLLSIPGYEIVRDCK